MPLSGGGALLFYPGAMPPVTGLPFLPKTLLGKSCGISSPASLYKEATLPNSCNILTPSKKMCYPIHLSVGMSENLPFLCIAPAWWSWSHAYQMPEGRAVLPSSTSQQVRPIAPSAGKARRAQPTPLLPCQLPQDVRQIVLRASVRCQSPESTYMKKAPLSHLFCNWCGTSSLISGGERRALISLATALGSWPQFVQPERSA